MPPDPRPARRRTAVPPPDVQKLLELWALGLAAALEWKRLTDSGDLNDARKKARETIRFEKEWRKHGGKGRFI